jgi:two-component system response regulator DevR
MLRVALIDDHEIVRRGLRDLLEATGEIAVVADAGSVAEALSVIKVDEIDVAVLDVRLPDGSGVELCRELLSQRADLACLILTSFADDEAMTAAVVAGARGYVLKDIRGHDLIESIMAVGRGESLISDETMRHVRDRVHRRLVEQARIESLSAQERRILDLLAEGMTNREIAETMFLAEKTVKNYVSNLLAKLGFDRRTEAALYSQKMHDEGLLGG